MIGGECYGNHLVGIIPCGKILLDSDKGKVYRVTDNESVHIFGCDGDIVISVDKVERATRDIFRCVRSVEVYINGDRYDTIVSEDGYVESRRYFKRIEDVYSLIRKEKYSEVSITLFKVLIDKYNNSAIVLRR